MSKFQSYLEAVKTVGDPFLDEFIKKNKPKLGKNFDEKEFKSFINGQIKFFAKQDKKGFEEFDGDMESFWDNFWDDLIVMSNVNSQVDKWDSKGLADYIVQKATKNQYKTAKDYDKKYD